MKNWQETDHDNLSPDDLNGLIKSNHIISGKVDAVKSAHKLKSGWIRYLCKMSMDSEGDVMTHDFYVRQTAHSVRNSAPLMVDGWWYTNSGMSLERSDSV